MGKNLAQWLKSWIFDIATEANGETERFVRPLEKVIRAYATIDRPWTASLQEFLMNYTATPHSTVGKAPADVW